MPRHPVLLRAPAVLAALGLLGGVLALAAPVAARAEPAITSPFDAACREQAKSRVFTVPDPLNLGLREIGRQIYMACMKQLARPAAKRRPHRVHRYRRR